MPTRRPFAITSLRTEDQGTVTLMFGMMSLVLLFVAGMAIDYSRVLDLRGRVADAIDAASLAVGRQMLEGNLSDDELVTLGKKYVTTNINNINSLVSVDEPKVVIDRVAGTVDISVDSLVAMTLTRLGGFDNMKVPVASAAVFKQSDLEVGMALDITGSMKTAIGGKKKIDSLKAAVKSFADELYPTQANSTQKVRIALAPYSASVKLGAYAATITTKKTTDGCVSEREGGAANDTVSKFHVKADSTKDVDSTGGLGNAYLCPPPAITPLSASKDAVIAAVDAYTADGSTGGHFGVQWAWNLISDNWNGVWGGAGAADSYDQVAKGKLIKAVVLMTDGEFNTAFHGQKSSEQAIALCTAMKDKDVLVFSVGFGLGGDPNAIKTLQTCATPGEGYFANAENEEQLEAAFKHFAAKLSQLRLSK